MSMTLAARSHHLHHVSRAAPMRVGPLAWFRRRLRHRPGSTLAHCAFAVAGVLVLMNALSFQREGSPRGFIGAEPASPARQAAPAPLPQPPARPADLAATPAQMLARPPAPVPAAQPQVAQRPLSTSREPAAREATARDVVPREVPPREVPAARDPIGDLIRTGQVASDPAATATRQAAAETRPVLAAQRALNRLGHGPIKADGAFGEETRAALERFERERRIPVTRDLSPRTLRELSAAAGLRLE